MLNTPFPTRNRAEAWRAAQGRTYQGPEQLAAFLAKEPRVVPSTPPMLSGGVVALAYRLLLFMLLAILVTVAFFMVGEERADSVVRPTLTARQRAQAFR
jgi:hypothetical protein